MTNLKRLFFYFMLSAATNMLCTTDGGREALPASVVFVILRDRDVCSVTGLLPAGYKQLLTRIYPKKNTQKVWKL